MYPILHDCPQGSDLWFKTKLGKVSASRFKDVLNKKTGRGLYMRRLAGEVLTGQQADAFSNDYMAEGLEKESQARAYYEQTNAVEVQQVGFFQSDDFVGISPDGLIGSDGGLEIKCPIPSTHIKYVQEDRLPTEYVAQVQGSLLVTGRQWWDFVSFSPEMTGRKFWCKRITRDEEYIAKLSLAIKDFVVELAEVIAFFEKPY